tara:strand:- start:4395 stop:4802 length:408 start_codon:yes stop_codon:yes gene_type:complete
VDIQENFPQINFNMCKSKKKDKFFWPKYSLFGFKILSSLQSVYAAYFLYIFENLVTPFFGVDENQIIAGILFSLIINFSIIILILNSLIQFKKVNIYFKILYLPLLIYIPISINKIFLELSYLNLFLVDLYYSSY